MHSLLWLSTSSFLSTCQPIFLSTTNLPTLHITCPVDPSTSQPVNQSFYPVLICPLYTPALNNSCPVYLPAYPSCTLISIHFSTEGAQWLSGRVVCDALHNFLDNIFIRFGSKLYRQIVGIPMDTNCAPLVADSFLFCYERDFMFSLSDNNQTDIIEAFKSTSRYLDDLLNLIILILNKWMVRYILLNFS